MNAKEAVGVKRTGSEMAAAFKTECDVLLAEEVVCVDCQETARDAAGTMLPRVCGFHRVLRRVVALYGICPKD